MKKLILEKYLLSFLILITFSNQIFASTNNCFTKLNSILAKVNKVSNNGPRKTIELAGVADNLIQQTFPDVDLSYRFFGQKPVTKKLYNDTVTQLAKTDLDIKSIQRAHKKLSGGRSSLIFRGESHAKVMGELSHKRYQALDSLEIEHIEKNPFLTIVKADDVTKKGMPLSDVIVADINFPNIHNYKQFEKILPSDLVEKIKAAKKLKKITKVKEEGLNREILEVLLNDSLAEAYRQIEEGKKAPYKVLAELEWRIKSLGLYYDDLYKIKGKRISPDLSNINHNKSEELAEVIVDTIAEQYGLKKHGEIIRGHRPKLTQGKEAFETYMKEAFEGKGVKNLETLVNSLVREQAKLPLKDREIFHSYYMTRVLTGLDIRGKKAKDIVAEFKKFKSQYYKRTLKEKERVGLYSIEYIRNFGNIPKDLHKYQSDYFFSDEFLYRGVSDPRKVDDKEVVSYFNWVKGRYASERSRIQFNAKDELNRLEMLRFNALVIEGKILEEVYQHAMKHEGYSGANHAVTGFVSATTHDTVAARFAMDKGYITSSSAGVDGNSHILFEHRWPKQGGVDYMTLKKTEAKWKNYFARQKEVSIAGAIDQNSLHRVYIMRAWKKGEKKPSSGPEIHGKIIKIFERDVDDPTIIWQLEIKKDSVGDSMEELEWERVKSYPLRKAK